MAEDHVGRLLSEILQTEPAIQFSVSIDSLASTTIDSLQQKSARELVSAVPGLSLKQAGQLKGRLDVAMAAMMRAFREQRTSGLARRAADELKGLLDICAGPTFEHLFYPPWGTYTYPEAIDATTSPVAYLMDLLYFIRDHLECRGDPDKSVSLRTRRPDLYAMRLDEDAMNRVLLQIEVVIDVLERLIEEHDPLDVSVDDKLLHVRYPMRTFPYEEYWQQIKTVFAFNQVKFSDMTRLSDVRAPYFIQPGAHSSWSDVALQQDSELGPALRALLIEPAYFGSSGTGGIRFDPRSRKLLALPAVTAEQKHQRAVDDSEQFFKTNFGVDGHHDLLNVLSFCQALQIDRLEMESLFGLGAHAPVRSLNAPAPSGGVSEGDTEVSPAHFGARFINSGYDQPVAVAGDAKTPGKHIFLHLNEDRCDRVNRLVRLAANLQLTYAETDQLVCAAIDAEHHAFSIIGRLSALQVLTLTPNTMRAIGLFQDLRTRFDCTAETFAALLGNLSVFAVGTTKSQFDRIFNSGNLAPLKLDGQAFSMSRDDAPDDRTVEQLCNGLGIDIETFRYLARLVSQGQGSQRLHRDLPTVSAFYRVTALAELLSVTSIELLSLLEVLRPQGHYALLLVDKPRSAMYEHFEQADTISVIHAVIQCVIWCKAQNMPISWLVQQVLPLENNEVVLEDITALFYGIKSNLVPFQDFNLLLSEAGVTPLRVGDWHSQLSQIVDEKGLITESGNVEEDFDTEQYENFARREIAVAIKQLMGVEEDAEPPAEKKQEPALPELTEDEFGRLRDLILSVVLRIRTQQWGVAQEHLSQFLRVNNDVVISLIYWAGEKAHSLLKTASTFDPEQAQSVAIKAVLPFIHRLRRCAEVANRYSLSPALFSSLLVRSRQSRFSVVSTDLTLHTLYYLERYTYCLRAGRQTEEQLLAYFALVEGVGDMSDTEAPLIRDAAAEKIAEWLGWGVREVFDVAAKVAPDDGIIRSLDQLCVLVATREMSSRTGLSATSLLKLSRLSSHDDVSRYRDAAEQMLSSLYHERTQERRDDSELRQSLSPHCLVASPRLVAKSKQMTKITLRLLDLNNEPVPRIRVNWSTTLGILHAEFSYTDEQGEASVELEAGDELGVAHVTAHYLLDSKATAQPIEIDCDEGSLTMKPLDPEPPEWVLAGNQGTYTLRARLVDRYDNPAVNRLVIWTAEHGVFVDSFGETLTDLEGYSTIKLRSLDPGSGKVTWAYVHDRGSPAYLTLTFRDQPYIFAFALASSAVAGEPIKVMASVLSLNEKPIADQMLKWECTGADLIDADLVTDDKGLGHATLLTATSGEVEVNVRLVRKGDKPDEYVSKSLKIQVLKDAKFTNARQSLVWPEADGIQAAEYEIQVMTSDEAAIPVARYPVTWSVDEKSVESEVIPTGPDGISRYLLRSSKPQTQTVNASKDELQEKFDPIVFIPPLEVEILFEGQEAQNPIIIVQSGADYCLTYRLAQGHPLLAEPANLLYFGRRSAHSLGLKFTPTLGTATEFKGEREVSWTITCEAMEWLEPVDKNGVDAVLGISHGNLRAPVKIPIRVIPAPQG